MSAFAYDADGPDVFGFGPGLTVLMGLPPPMPSAMALKMWWPFRASAACIC